MVDSRPSVMTPIPKRQELRIRAIALASIIVLTAGAARASDWQLFAFTTQTATGDAGVLTMNRMCWTEFLGSRMCTTDEIVSTIDPQLEAVRRYAWVHSNLVAALSSTHTIYDSLGKAVNLASGHSPNCEGWSYSATSAVTITTDTGGAIVKLCSESRPIACCKDTDPSIFADDFEDGTTIAWSQTTD